MLVYFNLMCQYVKLLQECLEYSNHSISINYYYYLFKIFHRIILIFLMALIFFNPIFVGLFFALDYSYLNHILSSAQY